MPSGFRLLKGGQSATSRPSNESWPGRPRASASGRASHAEDRPTRLQARALPMLSQCPYAHHATVLTRPALREQGERNQENAAGHPAGAAAEEVETGQEDRQP